MSNAERATIHVVAGAEPPVQPPVGEPGGPLPASAEPEAQPPITTPVPPQELEPDLGGPVIPSPSADERVEASGGSVADRLRARWEGIAATEEFGVPGWQLPDGRDGLIIVARTFGDRKAINAGVSNEVFIAKSTHELYLVDDDGSREKIDGGWGPGLARMIGVDVAKAADLVALVISKPDPNDPRVRIPNVTGIAALAGDIVAWARKSHRDAEESLGE